MAVRGAAVSAGIGPAISERDPYRRAWAAMDEAMRDAVCVGADPDQVGAEGPAAALVPRSAPGSGPTKLLA